MSMIGQLLNVPVGELERLLKAPQTVRELTQRCVEAGDECELYKAWQAIHYLLTGDPWEGEPPLCWAVLGDKPVGDVDVCGYGPARYLLPDQVRAVARALEELPAEKLRERFDLQEMLDAEIYSIDDRSSADENWEFVREHYEPLVAFYRDSASRGEAVIAYHF